MMTFYWSRSSCALAPHIVLEEVGEPYQAVHVSTVSGETRTPEWAAINPKARVPALGPVPGSAGGAPDLLTEANAIMIHLALRHPEHGLFPSDPARAARIVEWLNWLSGTVHNTGFAPGWRPERFADGEAEQKAVARKSRSTIAGQLDYIERLLGDGRDWAVPGGYTLVEPLLLVIYNWSRMRKFDMASYPAFTRLMANTVARPAVQRALAQHDLGFDFAGAAA